MFSCQSHPFRSLQRESLSSHLPWKALLLCVAGVSVGGCFTGQYSQRMEESAGKANAAAAANVWYVAGADASSQNGPYTEEQMVQYIGEQRVAAETMIWREGMQEWQPAGDVAEFGDAFGAPPGDG